MTATNKKRKGATVPLRRRRTLLRAFRKQNGLSLIELGKLTGLSFSMLSQFELGDRDLSSEAWARVVAAIEKLLAEDDARHKQEQEKAAQTAAKLGAAGLPNLHALARIVGSQWKPSQAVANPLAPYDLAFSGSLSRLQALAAISSNTESNVAALESLGLDDPIISAIVESLRDEVAKLEARIKELEATGTLHEHDPQTPR